MLTSQEVAAALGVSPKRARQLLQQGRIPGATKIGRDWLAPEPLRVIPGKRGPKPQAKSVAPTGRRQDFERLLETQRLRVFSKTPRPHPWRAPAGGGDVEIQKHLE